MGEDGLAVVTDLGIPLARPPAATLGEVQLLKRAGAVEDVRQQVALFLQPPGDGRRRARLGGAS